MPPSFLKSAFFVAALLLFCGPSGARAEPAPKMAGADLAANFNRYEGSEVTLTDCVILNTLEMTGATCGFKADLSSPLVRIDESWSGEAKALLMACNTIDIGQMCLVEVTGKLSKNQRGGLTLQNASVKVIGKTSYP